MAIPYNPSSFATNKTILQAIEELKNYLKDNPCYKIYYVNTPYVVGTTTYNLSDVDDTDGTMTAFDVVFFTNSYYAKVINVDTNTFDIDSAVSFKGATGQAGADGVSVSGATINASGHLIITLSDGNTIDAGSVVISYDNTVEITANSGTLSDDDYNKLLSDDSHIKYNSDVYYKNSESSVYIHFFHITSGGHAAHKQTVKITKATKEFLYSENFFMIDEDSISATNVAGEVLMSNGDGTASWGTVSTGYENTVSITATSGTFTDSDFAKLGYGDSTIVYTDAYSVSTVYKLKIETASILEFEAIDATSRNNLKLIDVNKTTKAYSMTAISMITSSTISSGTATSGKVLTANGSGGCSWETAGGGGSLYRHNIRIQYNSSTYKKVRIYIVLITNSATALSYDTDIKNNIGTIFGNNQMMCATGRYETAIGSGQYYQVIGFGGSGGIPAVEYFDGTNTTIESLQNGNYIYGVSDVVSQIS